MTSPTLRDCTDEATWWPHIDEAVRTIARGGLAVIPTDTVYGIAADAFTPGAVANLLGAKGRGRQMPPPVLIGDVRTLDALAIDVSIHVRHLVEEFWPGPLTVIVNAQPTLMWDLGETEGTVALRMPDNACALALLRRTGPLAVSSANASGAAAALNAQDAADQLGDAISIYLDAGEAQGGVASTIVDATGPELQVVRHGALSVPQLAEIAPIFAPKPAEENGSPESGSESESGTEAGTGAPGAEHEPDGEPPLESEPQEPEPGAEPQAEKHDDEHDDEHDDAAAPDTTDPGAQEPGTTGSAGEPPAP